MKIGLIGSGQVARTIGGKLAELGHDVVFGTRSPEKLDDWLQSVEGEARAASVAEAAAHGELLVNATAGTASIEALQAAGAENLAGKILIDAANPLDFSRGMPPTLTVCNDDSLGEQIQRTFPATRVVKALNTVNISVMTDPQAVGNGDHHLFICGDDASAKAEVTRLLTDDFGWQHVVDLGGIQSSRGTEMYLLLWLNLMSVQGTPVFNIKLVR